MRAEIETGADEQTTRHVAVRGLIHLDARELHVFGAGLQGVRAESVGVLRRPLQTVIALEIPAVVRREHRQPKTGEDLLLLRDTKPALQRRNARRLRIASEECHVAVQSTGEARCRLHPMVGATTRKRSRPFSEGGVSGGVSFDDGSLSKGRRHLSWELRPVSPVRVTSLRPRGRRQATPR